MDALNSSPHLSPKESKTYPRELCPDSITSIFYILKFCIILLIFLLLFLLEENPKSDDEEDPEIIVVSPSSREHSADSTSTLPYSYGQAVFPTSSPISSITTTSLPIPSSQDSFKSLSSSSSHFPFYSALHSSSISILIPLLILILYLLFLPMPLWTIPLFLYPTPWLHLHPVLCPSLTLFIDPCLYMLFQGLLIL